MVIQDAIEDAKLQQESTAGLGLVRAASLIAIGNIASRVLGLARTSVIAYLFGASGLVSAYEVASTLVQQLYDFTIGGLTSAALVPVFSDLAERHSRQDLWRFANIAISALAVLLASAVLVLEFLAPQIVWILGGGYDPGLQAIATEMIRLILPAVFFLGMSGVVSGLLYSLKRFAYPAFATAAFNAGIVICALALAPALGITSLIIGTLAGSLIQLVLQLPGLRDMRFRVIFDWRHPALRRIFRLYVPVLAGLAIAQAGVALDRYLVSFTGSQSLAWMRDATVLIQFPLGLVATAISFAILPHLSRQAENRIKSVPGPTVHSQPDASDEFRSTLALGVKLIVILIVPATIGMFLLAQPLVAVVFERGAFTPTDTFWASAALRYYLIGLPFAAIDQPLVFAFYAYKNTIIPNLVAFVGVAIYAIVAFVLIQPLGMLGLVLANSAQLTGHAVVMVWVTHRHLGGFSPRELGAVIAKVACASLVMGVVVSVTTEFVPSAWLKVLIGGLLGIGTYLFVARFLRLRDLDSLWRSMGASWRQRRLRI